MTEPEQPKMFSEKQDFDRGDLIFSEKHDMLVLKLGKGRSLFIRSDGTLLDRDTPSPLEPGETVHVFHDPKGMLAAFVGIIKDACATDDRPKAV
jgi:hypothetical protein